MTCSPDQSLFTNAVELADVPNKNKQYVKRLAYGVDLEFAGGLYESCKNVSNPTTGSKECYHDFLKLFLGFGYDLKFLELY